MEVIILLMIVILVILIILVIMPGRKIWDVANQPNGSASDWLLTWKQTGADIPTITALAGDGNAPQIFTVDTPTIVNGHGSVNVNVYLTPEQEMISNQVTVTLNLHGQTATTIITDIACLDGDTLISTLRGWVKASDIHLGDACLQLDGRISRVIEITQDFLDGYIYQYQNSKVTYWHQIRLLHETQYVVAGRHPGLVPIRFTGPVYHFRLEKITDDLVLPGLIAESLNDLPHGQEVVR